MFPKKMKTIYLLIVMASLSGCRQYAFVDCAGIVLNLKGSVDGGPRDEQLRLRVVLNPRGDFNPQSIDLPIKGATIEAQVVYNPRQLTAKKDYDCNLRPNTVTIKLLSNDDSELDSVELTYSKDFVRQAGGEYVLRSPLILHAERGSTPRTN